MRSYESFGSRSFATAGSSTPSFVPKNSLAGAAYIVPPHLARSGNHASSPFVTFPAPFSPFTPPELETQQHPVAYSTPKAESNAFTPSPDDPFTSFAGGRRPGPGMPGPAAPMPSSSSFAPGSAPTMPIAAPPARPSRASKVCKGKSNAGCSG